MQKKPFDPDSFADDVWKDEGHFGGLQAKVIKTSYNTKPSQHKKRKVKACHVCGSTTYTRLRYDKDAVGFRRDSAIGCTKCVK